MSYVKIVLEDGNHQSLVDLFAADGEPFLVALLEISERLAYVLQSVIVIRQVLKNRVSVEMRLKQFMLLLEVLIQIGLALLKHLEVCIHMLILKVHLVEVHDLVPLAHESLIVGRLDFFRTKLKWWRLLLEIEFLLIILTSLLNLRKHHWGLPSKGLIFHPGSCLGLNRNTLVRLHYLESRRLIFIGS